MEKLCSFVSVGKSCEDFCFGGVGLEKINVGKDFFLLFPVLKEHCVIIKVYMAKKCLNINGNLTPL